MTDDANIARIRRKKNEEAWFRNYNKERSRMLARLLKLKDFRTYMSEIMCISGTFENTFDEKGNVAAFNTGKHSIGIKIFNDIIDVSPVWYTKMVNEERVALEEKILI